MGVHLIHRAVLSIPVLFGVLLLGFMLLQLVPGDVAQVIAGPQATPEVIEQIRKDLGLDRSRVIQFFIYITRVMQGDLGYSMINNTPVIQELGEAIGPTFELMFGSLIFSVPIGIALGTIAAVNRGHALDRIIIAISVFGVSMPVFFIGLMLIMYVGYHWELLPFLGRAGPLWTLDGLAHAALPSLTLGLIFIGPVARMTRTAALEVMNADYVRTARAKGLAEHTVIIRHVLRNALIPVVTLIGLQAGYLWQSGQFVFGGETDLQLSGAEDTFAPWKFSNPWFGTLRGRAGVAFNNILLYGTLGLAYGGVEGQIGGLTESRTHLGWAGGLGIEVGFTPNWSARAEYLYVDLQDRAYSITGTNNGVESNLLRFGVNYRF